jgi:uridine kinase
MRLITISGRAGSGKSTLAQKRYDEYKSKGLSVAMLDNESYGNYYSDDRATTSPDVKIVTKMTDDDLKEATAWRR